MIYLIIRYFELYFKQGGTGGGGQGERHAGVGVERGEVLHALELPLVHLCLVSGMRADVDERLETAAVAYQNSRPAFVFEVKPLPFLHLVGCRDENFLCHKRSNHTVLQLRINTQEKK